MVFIPQTSVLTIPRQSPTEREPEAGWLEYPDVIEAGEKRERERERERRKMNKERGERRQAVYLPKTKVATRPTFRN